MATAQDLLDIARSQIGTNSGRKYWDWYFGGGYVNGSVTPWCACFTSWLLNQAGVSCPGFPRAVAIDTHDDFAGRKVSKWDLQPGDMVGFDWDGDAWGDHIGVVESRDGDVITTIEGNTSGGVCARCTRYMQQITCGARPYYDDTPTPPRKLEVDGYAGPATLREWQRQLGSPYIDGRISGQIWDLREHFWGVVMDQVDFDGSGESWMVKKIQGNLGVGRDGIWGPKTSKAIQAWLNSHGASLEIDGYFGRESAKALQRELNKNI